MRNSIAILPLLSCFALTACVKKGDDTSATDTTDTSSAAVVFSVSGTASNLVSGAAAPEGLCVSIADPTAALGGGDLTILSSSTIGAAGAYELDGITTTSAAGLLVLVEDCASEGTVMPTATGMKADEYSTLADGDAITGFSAYSIDSTSQAGIQAGLAGAGYTGDIGTDGALVGFVFDASGTPVDGAVVGGPDAAVVYYGNADHSFNTTGTVAAAGSMFVIPAAGIWTYTCTATGQTFPNVLAGSQPGYAVLIRFVAN